MSKRTPYPVAQAGDNGSSVQFAFQITAKQKASAITGYEFGIKSLMQSAPTDQQARLMALAGIAAPAPKLEAPAPAPAADPAPAPVDGEPAKPAKPAKK